MRKFGSEKICMGISDMAARARARARRRYVRTSVARENNMHATDRSDVAGQTKSRGVFPLLGGVTVVVLTR